MLPRIHSHIHSYVALHCCMEKPLSCIHNVMSKSFNVFIAICCTRLSLSNGTSLHFFFICSLLCLSLCTRHICRSCRPDWVDGHIIIIHLMAMGKWPESVLLPSHIHFRVALNCNDSISGLIQWILASSLLSHPHTPHPHHRPSYIHNKWTSITKCSYFFYCV